MTDVFDTLADSKAEIFSTLDLRSGFWQVPLDPATKHKSAFITHKGVYEFNRLAFGMMNSPMTFQCLLTKVLKDLNFKIALVYIDDILIFSKSFEENLHHLQLVFSNLRSAKLKLNPEKCNFGTKTVKYLGHIISKDGIYVNPENVDKVKNFPRPSNAKQVRSFLGMANFYRKFVKDYAKIASPLTALLKKNQQFYWTSDCQNAFENLKDRLTTAPILTFPKMDKPFILSTDASEYSVGYILSQKHDTREHVIAYGGRGLRGAELKWHITDKEALALVEGIQHFKHYQANQEFTVFTDNISVKYLQKIKDCNGRLGRWSLLLQAYNFRIQHRSGDRNPADYLSRHAHSNTKSDHSSELSDHLYSVVENQKEYAEVTLFYKGENVDSVVSSLQSIRETNNIDSPNLAKEQQKCNDFMDIIKYKQSGQVPKDPARARTIAAESFNYEIEDGILKHFYSKRCKSVPKVERLVKQIAVPKVLRDDLLKSYHDCIAGGGHQGFERTYAALRNKYYWPSMYADINTYVKTCETCQQSKRAFNSRPPPLQPQHTHDVFQRWHIDILSGLPTTKDKFKHILLIVDSYSKWCEAFPLRTQEATEVANVLYKEIITRYGAPRYLISDNGKTFVSSIVKALSELFNITRYLTSLYHPQTNGSVERMNSVILQAFRAYTKDMQDDWIDYLPGILMAYCTTPATQSTDYSPFFLMYGREMALPIDTALIPKDHLSQDHKIFLARILQNLENTRNIAAKNIEQAQQKFKENYDKKTKDPEFRPAQRVWLYCTKVPVGKAPKLHRKWVGPYYITKLGPHHTYKLRNCATNKEVTSLVNAQRLKPYYDPKDRPTNIPADLENDDNEHDPEELGEPANPAEQDEITQQPQENQENRDNVQVDLPKQDNSDETAKSKTNDQVNGSKPSCKDCERGNCKPFSESEIESIVSSARGNGVLYYKVKFADKTRKTDWYFTCKIPSRLVREFHAKRTMSGKKRKHPLQKHKFFNKSNIENINIIDHQEKVRTSIETQTSKETSNSSTQTEPITSESINCPEEKLISIRMFKGKAYFLVQQHDKFSWLPMTIAKYHASDFISRTKEEVRIHKHEEHIAYLRLKEQYGNKKPFIDLSPTMNTVFEVRFTSDGKKEFLVGFMNKNIPPEWAKLSEVSNGAMLFFLNGLERQ